MTAPDVSVAGGARLTKERGQQIACIQLACDGATLSIRQPVAGEADTHIADQTDVERGK